jgi:hypothetical protein
MGLRFCGRSVRMRSCAQISFYDRPRTSGDHSLEGLDEYDTGKMPKITFGPNRRIGALGANVVTIDPREETLSGKH